MKDIFVFYHYNCFDGFGSAWIIWKKLKNQARYIGFNYHNNCPINIKNKLIYFVDVCPSQEILTILKENNNRLILIDHHLSSQSKLQFFDEFKFDLKHSASVLTWKYFFPHTKIPKLFLYIEDIDIWKLKLPHTREINNAIDVHNFTFQDWNKLVKNMDNAIERKKYIKAGKIITEYQNKLVGEIAGKAKLVKFEGKEVLAANSAILSSEVGNILVKKRPPFAIIWFENGDKKIVSLRSNGIIDVSKIAEKYGGGGHKGAAGFSVKSNQKLPWEEL